MRNVKPCPYCGSEVEVVKLKRKENEKTDVYRISCTRCHALVARGTGFPCESDQEAQERIDQYKQVLEKKFAPIKMRYTRTSTTKVACQAGLLETGSYHA